MLPLPMPVLNGITLTHEELRQLHKLMRETVRSHTASVALDGPRLLSPARGEKYVLAAHGRDRDGSLLASVTIHMPWSGPAYVRRVRLVKARSLNLDLDRRVARGSG